MKFLATPDDEPGEPADTGSATHRAAQAMHKEKVGTAECIAAMQRDLAKYPAADLRSAAEMFLNYTTDPRNAKAEVALCEQFIEFCIAPAADDPTQAPIKIIGTLDQVRIENGRYTLWDLKTSKKDGTELLRNHMFQAAAYCVGASIHLGTPVHPGGLILPRKYKAGQIANSPVFWHFAWSLEDTEYILEPVRHRVRDIRMGRITHMPHKECDYCPGKTPDICLPRLKRELPMLRTVLNT